MKKSINWSALRTKVLIAFVSLVAGIVWGYFIHADINQNARAVVVQDIQLVKEATPSK